jgi:3-oxoacyl-[acyl-carrier protein] reductase
MNTTREKPLAGKVALVTGGSRGIGAAIAKRLATDGASVAVTYSKGADAAASVVKEIERGGGKGIAIHADAADADAVRNAVDRTVRTLGRLDVLVNNAGTIIPAKVEETTLADFDRVFAINVRGTFVATQAALKHLKTGGRIIMIGSCLGERVFMPGAAPYSATRQAWQSVNGSNDHGQAARKSGRHHRGHGRDWVGYGKALRQRGRVRLHHGPPPEGTR